MADVKKTIYIADDDDNIRMAIKTFLITEGYIVTDFTDGDLLFKCFISSPCDLVILDVMMPGSDGFIICREIRKISTVPIIMLTARDSDIDYATGLNLGSDDYFTKPFSAISLVMRVKAIFRRIEFERRDAQPSFENREDAVISFADIKINKNTKTVYQEKNTLDLTPTEYNFLCYMIENKEKAVSRDELLNKVWGYNSEVETKAADDTVRRLRKKLASSSLVVDTVWGFGFRLKVKGKNE